MGRPTRNLQGQRFGNLTALKHLGFRYCNKCQQSFWLCKCDCGKLCEVRAALLLSGQVKSCGCLKCDDNIIYIIGDVGICLLSNGGYFWFDAEDVELVERYHWHNHQGYARVRRDKKYVWFHRAVMGLTPDSPIFIDHINGDRHDSRKCNLRVCQHQQNMCHKLVEKGYVQTPTGRYRASITVRRKSIYLGTFDTPEEARAAYIAASKIYHGEFRSYDEAVIYYPM